MILYQGKHAELSSDALSCLIDDAIEQDVGISLSDVAFDFSAIDGKSQLKSIEFDNCRFRSGLKLSAISGGTVIRVEGCKFDNNSGLMLERVSVTNIYLIGNETCQTDSESTWQVGLLPGESITLARVVSRNLFINRCDFHVGAEESFILDGFKVTGVGEKNDDRVIVFSTCDFGNAQLVIQDCELERLWFNKCNHQDMFARLKIETKSGSLVFAASKVGRFDIDDSKIGHLQMILENTPVRNIQIVDSNLNSGLNLYMSATFSEADRRIHSLRIIDSIVGKSTFSGRIFDLPLDLKEVTFLEAPKFHNSAIPQGSHFPSKERFVERNGNDASKAYRTLRLAMEDQRAREEEGMFYALEQESILNTKYRNTKVFQLGYWYLKVSDCGTNFTKPLGYLVVVFIAFSLLYALLSSPIVSVRNPIDWSLLERASIFSLKQIFTPFWSLRDLSPLFEKSEISFLISFIGLLQSLISVLLITLIVFAIRWSFKRG